MNQVRNSGLLFGSRSVGFVDRSLWEKAKTKGRKALERLNLDGLEGTSATVVLVGERPSYRQWVDFEIEASAERGNALLGIRIHHLAGRRAGPSRQGRIPSALKALKAPIYRWDGKPHDLGEWVEEAIKKQCS